MSFSYGGVSEILSRGQEEGAAESGGGCQGGQRRAVPDFVADGNEDGGAPPREYMRVPNDASPFEGHGTCGGEGEGVCFPSQFAPDAVTDDDDMAADDLRTAYDRMMRMIRDNYSNNMVTGDLVDNVHRFYEQNVRANYPDMPVWTKRSIYNFIFFHAEPVEVEERQANESIRAIYHQIDFLRSHAVSRDPLTGVVTPDYRNIKLMSDLAKTHAQLVSAKRQRRK